MLTMTDNLARWNYTMYKDNKLQEEKHDEKHDYQHGKVKIVPFMGDIVGINCYCPSCNQVFSITGQIKHGNIFGISDDDIEKAMMGKPIVRTCHKFICPCNGGTGFSEEQASLANDFAMNPDLRTSCFHGCPDVIKMSQQQVYAFLQRSGPFKKGDQIDPHLTDIGLEMLGLQDSTHFKAVLGIGTPYTEKCCSQ